MRTPTSTNHTLAVSSVLGCLVLSLSMGEAARFIDLLSLMLASSGRNWTITAVILSQPVPSPNVLGARQ